MHSKQPLSLSAGRQIAHQAARRAWRQGRERAAMISEAAAQQCPENDDVLMQGDFGACYIMVSFSFDIGLIPVCLITLSEAVEERSEDGTIKMIHHFRHRMFRRYEA